MISRADILARARDWLGTPYQHQASVKGAGADCLGLVRGVWRDLYGCEPELPPAYSPDWAEAGGEETMYEAAKRHLEEVALTDALAGDVLLFRMAANGPAKHAAILSNGGRMIHAYSGRSVCETHLGPWWERRAVYAFRFPGVTG